MIVRILGEGQYSVPEGDRESLEKLDSALAEAVDSNDEEAFNRGLAALTAEVRALGESVADDAFAPSDLVVPFPDATLEETKGLLAQSEDSARTDKHRD
ncbi:MAG: PspA-associated protein PspAA [Acidimicrobiales bacterium]